MVVVVEADKADDAIKAFEASGEKAVRLGELKSRDGDAVIYDTMIEFGA
jgi:phosphoribosylformylglycinamidine cyclo-ligase